MTTNLTQMKPGEIGVITSIQGGRGMQCKLQNMGIRVGRKIKKISCHLWGGPQTILVDDLKFAIGQGMAKRIIVEIEK